MDKMRPFGGVYQKFFDKYAFCTNARLCFCATFYCVGFLKYHQTANTVTLNKSENAVGNIITTLRAFHRSDDTYRAACENLKVWHQTVFVVGTAKAYFPDRQSCSTLCRQPFGCARSVEVVAVYPSLGSYSVVGLFRWASPPFRRLLILPSIYKGMGKVKSKPEIQFFETPFNK